MTAVLENVSSDSQLYVHVCMEPDICVISKYISA